MKDIYYILLLAFVSTSLSAQIDLSGHVVDATSKEAIPFVNIGIKKIAKGTVSDMNGFYKLKSDSSEDLISFSSIGYDDYEITAKYLIAKDTIELTKKVYEIEQVEVQATRFNGEEKRFGLKNKTRGPSIAFGNAQLGTQIGSIIAIKKPTFIRSANFVLNHAKGDSLLFRVNIYAFEDGKVGESLLTENVYIKDKQRKGVISVDLSGYNLILDSDVLLSLEWLHNFDEKGTEGITFDMKKSRKSKGIYYKFFSNGDFKKNTYQKKFGVCFYFIGREVD